MEFNALFTHSTSPCVRFDKIALVSKYFFWDSEYDQKQLMHHTLSRN